MENRKAEPDTWELCSNTAVRRASRQLGQLYDDVLEPSGLRLTQVTLLIQIDKMNGPSLKALAEALVMDLSALGHTLKPLIRDGFLELVPDTQDRRVKRVRLTPFGDNKRREAIGLWQEAQHRFDRVFGTEASAALRQTMALISSKDFAAAFRTKPQG
ncbi:MarR family transcriptional regulator [Neorhizobium sp. P12A]|uniref:MarR family winged helix-turn-helix transcriptional regulator n=1 Tax=Neorhizobium sp. P12A TaxID=2268027 RepID=UPI0011EF4B57|nr:MarR family winged helix-turn-helix transcriptional regulator [Neorhizobium sp. P12A]KAA0698348.1 MarR family transcriptional regulator [Neorhizobium sp. P12A]